ncbi:MAG: hypothetical protein JWQ87_3944 [Candidatus Sulfotelmatobacter sp.]|nr:hypothetical protein [Candidatus Sulfotelmatobacter sp.]
MERMSRAGEPVRIPLTERKALAGLLQVKPTADMPRPSDSKKPSTKRKAARKKK